MKRTLLAALAVAALGVSGEAYAHGGVSLDQGQCIMKIGPDTMSFTGYQPIKSRETFCDDIPDVGPTIIVLDAQQDELVRDAERAVVGAALQSKVAYEKCAGMVSAGSFADGRLALGRLVFAVCGVKG